MPSCRFVWQTPRLASLPENLRANVDKGEIQIEALAGKSRLQLMGSQICQAHTGVLCAVYTDGAR